MSAARTTFYYDGDCGLCVAFTRRVSRLDRKGRVQWTPYQSLSNTPSPLMGEGWDGGETRAITLSDMERAAYATTPDGKINEGYHAIRALFRAIPILAPLGLLMSIPGASLIGVPLYRLVANNRRKISKSCRLQPKDTN